MFTNIKQTPTVSKGIALSQLRRGQLFTFHAEGHQADQVFMKIERPDGLTPPAGRVCVVSLQGGRVTIVEDCPVHLVDATMEWHFRPWSVQL